MSIQIIRNGSIASQSGSSEWFSGAVRIDMLVAPQEEASRNSFGIVTFEPGARTHWHTHPAGQMLIVTAGVGQVQAWGEAAQRVQAGDMVWFPAGLKHWHGATASTAMTHIAVQEAVDGSPVTWLEAVSDARFTGAQA